jgi:ATP-dependent DNA ligase
LADYIVHKAVELDDLGVKTKAALEKCERWVLSPKYDGCHAVLIFDGGKFIRAYSRTGETVYSLNHIGRSFEDNYDLPAGRVAVCGEAWIPGKEFNEISGSFRRQTGRITELYFVPFDYVQWDYNDLSFESAPVQLFSDRAYLYRISSLVKLRQIPSQIIEPTHRVIHGPLSHVLGEANAYARFLKARTDSFYDGAILAQADGRYQVGAGKGGEFIKVKPLISFTVTVCGVDAGTGAKTGKHTCALQFVLDDKVQKVSTGLTQEQVDEACTDPFSWIGKRIEVGAMGKTVNGFLREPRFLGIRSDA